MTKATTTLQNLSEENKRAVEKLFGSSDILYNCFYLLAKTEHDIQQGQKEDWKNHLESAQHYRNLAAKRTMDECQLPEGIIEDIFSDYFEDFANYREIKIKLTNETFVALINRLIAKA